MMPTTLRLAIAAGSTASLAALLCACSLSPAPASSTPPAGSQIAAIDPSALAPDRLRIHPLTRLTREPSASGGATETQLVCHIELKDRFGHNVKALGRLRIELYRPSGPEGDAGAPGASAECQDLVWDIDLRDPQDNALMYDDLVTRTYVVYLGGLPEWVTRWAAAESGQPWITLKAAFTAINCQGQENRLEATYRLQR